MASEYDAERRRLKLVLQRYLQRQARVSGKHEQIKERILCSTMFSAARTVLPRASMRVSYASVLFLGLA